MDTKKNNKKKMKIVKKPFLQGSPLDSDSWKDALKFFCSTLVMMVAFLFLSSMMMWDSMLLRLLTNGAVLLMALALFYASGLSKGAAAVNTGEILYLRREEGKPLNAHDQRSSYHPAKGFLVALLGSLPLLLCAILLAVTATQQLHGLSALPRWLESYTRRGEIGDALAYYGVVAPLNMEGVLRLIVRTAMMPLVSIVGTESSANLLLLERLSPLVMLVPSLCYGFGYTRGVAARTQVHSSIAAANRKHKRQEKKKQQQRRARGPEQLN